MVNALRKINPVINFGLGITEYLCAPDETVTVWLDTLYNQDEYVLQLDFEGTVKIISPYEYEVSYPDRGTYNITLQAYTFDKKISLQSNVITLTIE